MRGPLRKKVSAEYQSIWAELPLIERTLSEIQAIILSSQLELEMARVMKLISSCQKGATGVATFARGSAL